MIEPAATSSKSENDQQQQASDELQNSNASQQLTVDQNQVNVKNKVQCKCCASNTPQEDGKRGNKLDHIEANYLKVNVDNIVERIYRYDVDIRMNGPKKLYTKVFSQFCADYLSIEQSKQIAFDDNRMIALSPCKLDMGNRGIYRKFNFELPDTENDWKTSKKSQNRSQKRLNKIWLCEVAMKPARKFSIPLKEVLAG